MALRKCPECGREISSDAKVCPHCGKKQITTSFIVQLILGGILAIWIASSLYKVGGNSTTPSRTFSPSQPSISASYPSDQIAFHSLNRPYPARYRSGSNEIQKSAIFNECNKARKDFLKNSKFRVIDWIGKITSIGTDQGGDVAHVQIESNAAGFTISYKTWNNRLSDLFTESMLKKGSKVYNQVGQLSEGSLVKFSARFIDSQEKGIEEASMTEQGTVDAPEFIVKFDGILPYSSPQSSYDGTKSTSKAEGTTTESRRDTREPYEEPPDDFFSSFYEEVDVTQGLGVAYSAVSEPKIEVERVQWEPTSQRWKVTNISDEKGVDVEITAKLPEDYVYAFQSATNDSHVKPTLIRERKDGKWGRVLKIKWKFRHAFLPGESYFLYFEYK